MVTLGRKEILNLKNFEQIKSLGGSGNTEIVRHSVALFLEHTAKLLETLPQWVAEQNAPKIFQVAHRLKSSAAALGGERFSELARRLEQEAQAGLTSNAARYCPVLRKEFTRLKHALENELSNLNYNELK